MRNTKSLAMAVLASLISGILAVFVPASAADIKVSVFSHPDLVNETSLSCANEIHNLNEIIGAIPGFTVDKTISTLADDSNGTLLQKLQASRFFFVPDMEGAFSPTSTSYFPDTAVTAFRTWLTNGGVLVMTGTYSSEDVDFLNRITDWGMLNAGALNPANRNTSNVAGTPYAAADMPSFLDDPSATDALNKGSAPAGANFKAMWGTDAAAAVATMTYGAGTIIYMGWDFYDAGPGCPAATNTWATKIVPASLNYAAELSNSGLTDPTTSGGKLNYTFSQSGTSYYIVVPKSSTTPSSAQIKAGVSYTGATVVNSGNASTTANVEHVFTISGLTAATEYTAYVVTEYSSSGTPTFSAQQSLNFATLPGVPTVSSVTAGNGQVSVSIAPFGTETNFEYSTNGGSTWIARSSASVSSPWTITGLTNGTTYNFLFRSSFGSLKGAATSSFSATPATVPSAPSSLTATATATAGVGQVSLSWSAGANNGSAITGYKIERSSNSGSTWVQVTATTGSTATTFTDTGLAPANYIYRVYAINSVGTSLASTSSSAVTVTGSAPAAPTLVTATFARGGDANISWTAPTDNGGSVITGYKIEINNSGTWTTKVPTTGSTNTSATITGLTLTSAYLVRVSAINVIGTSAASTSTTVSPTAPTAPTTPIATFLRGGDVSVSWSAPTDLGGSPLTGYKIEVLNSGTWTTKVADTGTVSTTATLSGLNLTSGYSVRISAINAGGTSVASSAVSVAPIKPSLPLNLSILYPTSTSALVSWEIPQDLGGAPITSYNLQYKVGGDWITVPSSGTSATISGVMPNQAWTFRVAASNSAGSSDFASLDNVPPPPYSGPMLGGVSTIQVSITPNGPIELVGTKLDQITKVMIDNKEVKIISKTDTKLVLELPALSPGTKDIVFFMGDAKLVQQDALVVSDKPVATEQAAPTKVNAGSFKGYVALYAKGHEGKRFSAKVGKDWVIIPSLGSDFERIVEFTGAGFNLNVPIYIDRQLIETITVTTK